MKLRKLEFEGIRAFADKTVFRFGQQPGLYFLQGSTNEVDPELGSNAVGKSTIWSSLSWVLFGKTLDGLRAVDIKSWDSEKKGYYAKLWLGPHLIKRSWKPNKLTLDGEVVEQKELESRIGISFDMFTSAVILSQEGDTLFDLSPAKKLSMFTSLMGLDSWITYSDSAKMQVSEVEDKVHIIENSISRIEGAIDGLDLESIRAKHKMYKSKKRKEFIDRKSVVKEFDHSLKEMRLRKKKSKKYAEKLARADTTAKGVKRALDKDIESLRSGMQKVLPKIERHKANISVLVERIQFLEDAVGTECDSCGQPITKKEASKQISFLQKQVTDLECKNQPLLRAYKRQKKTLENLRTELSEHATEYNKLQVKIVQQKSVYSELMEDLSDVQVAREIAEERFEEVKTRTNPFAALLREKTAKEDSLLSKLEKQRERLRKTLSRKRRLEYWIKGFKEIRLFLIEEALEQLQIETNRAMYDLGFSSQWSIRYAVEKMSKRGSVISGFNVYVKSPRTDKQVPFSVWSGGEKQRLRLAGLMGFMSLVAGRLGVDFGIEVYDEPTQHLSPEGIDSLLQTLSNRAVQTRRRVWLVDHHTLDYGDFTGHTIVNKDAEGRSSLCQH